MGRSSHAAAFARSLGCHPEPMRRCPLQRLVINPSNSTKAKLPAAPGQPRAPPVTSMVSALTAPVGTNSLLVESVSPPIGAVVAVEVCTTLLAPSPDVPLPASVSLRSLPITPVPFPVLAPPVVTLPVSSGPSTPVVSSPPTSRHPIANDSEHRLHAARRRFQSAAARSVRSLLGLERRPIYGGLSVEERS